MKSTLYMQGGRVMRKSGYIAALLIIVICMVTLAACSAKKNESTATVYDAEYGYSPGGGKAVEMKGADNGTSMNLALKDAGSLQAMASAVDSPTDYSEKIIRDISMNVETKEFDKLIGIIEDEIETLGGYKESGSIVGRRYSSNNSLRRGNIVVRIPKDKADLFIDTIYDSANVIYKNENSRNITLEYYDIESHKKALEIEQERLFELLKKTESVEEIISLESRLSSIRYELSQYETQLRIYDNKVDYATITLEIEEVERMSPAAEAKVTVWNRIRTGFNNTMYNLGRGFQNFFVWFVVNLPYLLILGVVAVVAFIVIRKYTLKKNRKRNNNMGNKSDASDTPDAAKE
jgi:hypothetical protein